MFENNLYEFKILTEKMANFKTRNNLTYQQFGDATKVNKSHIHRVINQESYPSLKFIIRLAQYMKLPVFSLFIPSEEMARKEFSRRIEESLKKKQWDVKELSKQTRIRILRLMDIIKAVSSPTRMEYKAIAEALDLETINFLEIKLNLLNDILHDLELEEDQIANVIKYVEDNIK